MRRVEKRQKLLLLAVQSQSSTFVGLGPWFYWFIQVEPDPGPAPHHPNARSLTGGPVCPCVMSSMTETLAQRVLVDDVLLEKCHLQRPNHWSEGGLRGVELNTQRDL